MKVTTKVAAGASLLFGLLMVALVREMALVRTLATAQRMLSEQRFRAIASTLDILRTLELSEERLQKLYVTRDAAYSDKLETLGHKLEDQLALQGGLGLPASEQNAVGALSEHWRAYQADFRARRVELTDPASPSRERMRAQLVDQLDLLRADAIALLSALNTGIQKEVDRAQEEARRGEERSLALVALAVASGVFFVFLTMRSLNQPLSRLIAATRSVATGHYTRLAPRGGDELSELARAFDKMVEQLDEVDRTKREFLSHVSHELKTPLAAMQETNQLLYDELAGPLTDSQRRMLQLNLDAGRRLSAMLSRLLDSSRLEAGAVYYDVRPVEVGELLGVAFDEFAAKMRDKGLTATLDQPEQELVIHADRDWLVQVFENLLENAIKFSPPERRLWVRLRPVDEATLAMPDLPEVARALARRTPTALVTVADEGPGIPDEAQDRLFERFFQIKHHARAGNGVGLGLAICRDIVAAHGGALWARNRVEGGSVFSVLLPLWVEPAGADAGCEDQEPEEGVTVASRVPARRAAVRL